MQLLINFLVFPVVVNVYKPAYFSMLPFGHMTYNSKKRVKKKKKPLTSHVVHFL